MKRTKRADEKNNTLAVETKMLAQCWIPMNKKSFINKNPQVDFEQQQQKHI